MILVKLESSNLLELFVTFASSIKDSAANQEWTLIIFDIFYSLFCRFSPRMLLDCDKDEDMLKLVQQQTSATNILNMKKFQRHPRFGGTLTMQMGNNSRYVYSAAKGINVALPDIVDQHANKTKKRASRKEKKTDDNTDIMKEQVSKKSRKILCKAAQLFIESGFDVLMETIKKDIERERDYLRQEDVQYFSRLLAFCLEYLNLVIAGDPNTPLTYNHVSCVLNIQTVGFFLKRIMEYHEEKSEKDVFLDIRTFNELIKTIEGLTLSRNEEYVDLAENLQRNLFYREEYLKFLQRIVAYPLTLTTQYLSALAEMTHHLVRLMERYLKTHHTILVQRKARKVSKRNKDQQPAPPETAAEDGENGVNTEQPADAQIPVPEIANPPPESIEDEEDLGSEEDEEDDDGRSSVLYKEMVFEFCRFEVAYASEATLLTYFQLLSDINNLSGKTIHHVTKMLYRVFVKCEAEALFYKIDFLNTLNGIMQNRRALILKHKQANELIELIRYITNKLIKKLKEYPELFVEMLFSKSKSVWRKIQYGDDFNSRKAAAEKTKKNLEDLESSEDEKIADNDNNEYQEADVEGGGEPRTKKKKGKSGGRRRRLERAGIEASLSDLEEAPRLRQPEKAKFKSNATIQDSSDDDDETLAEFYRRRMEDLGGIPSFNTDPTMNTLNSTSNASQMHSQLTQLQRMTSSSSSQMEVQGTATQEPSQQDVEERQRSSDKSSENEAMSEDEVDDNMSIGDRDSELENETENADSNMMDVHVNDNDAGPIKRRRLAIQDDDEDDDE